MCMEKTAAIAVGAATSAVMGKQSVWEDFVIKADFVLQVSYVPVFYEPPQRA